MIISSNFPLKTPLPRLEKKNGGGGFATCVLEKNKDSLPSAHTTEISSFFILFFNFFSFYWLLLFLYFFFEFSTKTTLSVSVSLDIAFKD